MKKSNVKRWVRMILILTIIIFFANIGVSFLGGICNSPFFIGFDCGSFVDTVFSWHASSYHLFPKLIGIDPIEGEILGFGFISLVEAIVGYGIYRMFKK